MFTPPDDLTDDEVAAALGSHRGLADLAIYATGLRAPHVDSEDTRTAWRSLQAYLSG